MFPDRSVRSSFPRWTVEPGLSWKTRVNHAPCRLVPNANRRGGANFDLSTHKKLATTTTSLMLWQLGPVPVGGVHLVRGGLRLVRRPLPLTEAVPAGRQI